MGYFTSVLYCYFLASHFSIYFGPGFGISLHRKIPYSLYGKIGFKRDFFPLILWILFSVSIRAAICFL